MVKIPFASNSNFHAVPQPVKDEPPWTKASPGELPPMMFRIEFIDGRVTSYAYSDLRETRMRDRGMLQLFIFGMEKYVVTIRGRHLDELAKLIGLGRIRSLSVADPRRTDQRDENPSITEVVIESLTGPGV
jgi:hypothetical protein